MRSSVTKPSELVVGNNKSPVPKFQTTEREIVLKHLSLRQYRFKIKFGLNYLLQR